MPKKATSAHGLFKATGKTSKQVNVRLKDGSYSKASHRERQDDDFERTPPEATRAFLEAEQERLRDFSSIWEPAAGDGAMVREMRALGLHVYASDLIDRGCCADIVSYYDFPLHARTPDCIVTNPPFKECSWGLSGCRWIAHALDKLDVEYMALLLPFTWPSAGGMRTFYEAHRPARVYLMRWRVDFTGMGAQPSSHAFYIWDKRSTGETILRMLDRSSDARQSKLL